MSKVAALFTRLETVLQDYRRLFELAGGPHALQLGTTPILKEDISWHFPMPGANTTPWRFVATILALRAAGFGNLVCMHNQTVAIFRSCYVPCRQSYVARARTSPAFRYPQAALGAAPGH